MVWDDEASRHVWLDPVNGALAGMKPGSVAIECATLTTPWLAELHAACEARGVDCVDAPMSGSLPHAEAKTLVFVVGAKPTVLERVKPLLLAMIEMMSTTPVLSPRMHAEAKFMLAGNHETRVRVSQMVKDIGYAIEQARQYAAPAPLAEAARALFVRAAQQGFAEADMTVLAKLYARNVDTVIEG